MKVRAHFGLWFLLLLICLFGVGIGMVGEPLSLSLVDCRHSEKKKCISTVCAFFQS